MAEKKSQSETNLGDEESFSYESEYDFEDWKDIPPEDASRLLKGLEGLIPDVVKRTMSHLLASDEGLRALLSDKNIPKEVVGYLLGQVDATRRGFLRIVSKEIRVFLENVDFGGEIAKILTTLSFEVRTEIRFIPNEERVVPSVKNTVRVKRDEEGRSAGGSTASGSETEEEERDSEQSASSASTADPASKKATEPARKSSNRWTRRRTPDPE